MIKVACTRAYVGGLDRILGREAYVYEPFVQENLNNFSSHPKLVYHYAHRSPLCAWLCLQQGSGRRFLVDWGQKITPPPLSLMWSRLWAPRFFFLSAPRCFALSSHTS